MSLDMNLQNKQTQIYVYFNSRGSFTGIKVAGARS
jgi:lipid-binding SYLF domain-containing protein